MTMFTPGPWHAEQSERGTVVWATRSGDDDKHIVAVSHFGAPDTSIANARLIAAAPDLLAACQSVVPANVCLTNRNTRDDMVVPLECTMGDLRAIRAAIAKAALTTAQGQPS